MPKPQAPTSANSHPLATPELHLPQEGGSGEGEGAGLKVIWAENLGIPGTFCMVWKGQLLARSTPCPVVENMERGGPEWRPLMFEIQSIGRFCENNKWI